MSLGEVLRFPNSISEKSPDEICVLLANDYAALQENAVQAGLSVPACAV